ncbi:unnamed protein product [Cuscuta epithymum]|uniref:Uncharacterized protein n=1 Tax=Cuscuta epithymum TaxID=186058 RepID=A0AAV0CVT3_9ASTE|nr:unnamed protein product [Cuscuta epithymum]
MAHYGQSPHQLSRSCVMIIEAISSANRAPVLQRPGNSKDPKENLCPFGQDKLISRQPHRPHQHIHRQPHRPRQHIHRHASAKQHQPDRVGQHTSASLTHLRPECSLRPNKKG